jgi:hypothetical protein
MQPEYCDDCGAKLHYGDCPVCDPWPEDEFEDEFEDED